MTKKDIISSIFELLEHEVPKGRDISILHDIRKKGFRMALDDVSFDAQSAHRLEYFGSIANFIKLDGSAIREGMRQEKEYLGKLVQKIRDHVPRGALVAECVHSIDEARHLHNVFEISIVQGRHLPERQRENKLVLPIKPPS